MLFAALLLALAALSVRAQEREFTAETGLEAPKTHYTWSCASLLHAYRSYKPTGQMPPKTLSKSVQNDFTMDGAMDFDEYYVDDTAKGKGTHYKYNREMMLEYVGTFDPKKVNFQKFSATQLWLYLALEKFSPKGKHVLVFGSMDPYHESLLLALGAQHVTTVEYNKLTYDHDQITTVTPAEFTVPEGGYDMAISISSFDHDGLGRYGDPLDPVGDLKAMRLANCILKPDALLLVSVPVGKDVVAFNLHRRYGPISLPHFLDGWKIEHIEGWNPVSIDSNVNYRKSYEPIFVLRNAESHKIPVAQEREL